MMNNEGSTLDVFSSEFSTNPYPIYAQLRECSPVARVSPGEMWMVTRYDDVLTVLKNCDVFSSKGFNDMIAPAWLREECRRDLSILTQDPPEHTSTRALVSRAFIPRLINDLVPFMEETAEKLIHDIGDEPDFSADFAFPYAGKIIAKVTGLDRYQSVPSLQALIEITETINSVKPDDDTARLIEDSLLTQMAYFNAVITDRRTNPRGELIDTIVQSDGDDKKVRNIINLLIGAGFLTTAHALCNIILFLCEQPDNINVLREQPDLIPAFIEEMMRFNGPSHRVLRKTTRDYTLSGITIPKEATVLVALASANRDPLHFENPDFFDMHRPNLKEHVAFGAGPHVCIGRALAVQEIRVALEHLLRTYPRISCPRYTKLERIASLTTHGVRALPIRLSR